MNIITGDYPAFVPMNFKAHQKPRKQKEGTVVHACIQWLCAHGCDVIRNNTAAFKNTYRRKNGSLGTSYIRTGKKGSGDILACGPNGRWVEVECKTEDGKPSFEQIQRKVEIERRGGIYILARSIDDLEARKMEIIT